MKIFYSLLLCMVFFSQTTYAAFPIGHRTKVFNDASRSRDIEVEIYYPATTAGDNVPIASGLQFPVLVFGHGFLMTVDAYQNIVDELVVNGFIVCLPTTEGGIIPSHDDFGKDLAFVAQAMYNEGQNAGGDFTGAINYNMAVGGHSMGGGASVLAAKYDAQSSIPLFKCMVNFAAAETNPTASGAAIDVSIPSLIFAGENDCVAPIADHQQLIYDGLSSSCKYLITINGASHCQFANSNAICELGEVFCTAPASITADEQHDIMNQYLLPWLKLYLENDVTATSNLQTLFNASNGVSIQNNCNNLSINNISNKDFTVLPISNNEYQIINQFANDFSVEVIDLNGRELFRTENANSISLAPYSSGLYFVRIKSNSRSNNFKLIKN